MTETDSEDYPAERFDRAIRKSTKLEIGLVIMLASGLVSAVWWARGISSDLKTLTEAVAQYDPGANAVLVYRVTQLEEALLSARIELAALQRRQP
jgi:hypothetical protein